MRVLISWSGDRSRLMAEALRGWIPSLFQSVSPWMSAADIQPGSRWASDLASQLSSTDFGILCVTSDNIAAPWILFEAGALSKSVQSGQIVPYLLDLKPNDLVGPLAQFQAVTADRVGTQALVRAIAKASSSNRRNDATTDKVFGRWWPSLQAKLKQISPEESVLAKGHRKVKASTTKSERANQFDELIHDLEHFHSNPEGIFYIGNTLLQCEALFEQLAGAEAYIELVHDLMKEIDEDERKDMGVFDPIISVTKVSKLRRVLIGLRNNDLSVKPLG